MANVVYEAPPVYKRTWFIVVMLIYVFPVGLFLMWKYTNWKQWVKIAVTAVIAISWLSMIPACHGTEDAISEISENISSVTEEVSSVTETTTTEAEKIEVPSGAIVKEQDGLWGLYLGNNLVDNYTGIATNENGDWYIRQGVVDFDYSGTVSFRFDPVHASGVWTSCFWSRHTFCLSSTDVVYP